MPAQLPTRKRFKDLSGKIFNTQRVLSYEGVNDKYRALWLCECSICGRHNIVRGDYLSNPKSLLTSCGCKIESRKTHGLHDHDLYATWNNMKARCHNPNHDAYQFYGAKGIVVCNEWLESFPKFLADMGDRPPNCSLDRINPFGPYCKENCRWSTPDIQHSNTRKDYLARSN